MQVRRINTLDHIPLLRLHKVIVDEKPNGLIVLAAIGRCEGDEEVRHVAMLLILFHPSGGMEQVV